MPFQELKTIDDSNKRNLYPVKSVVYQIDRTAALLFHI